MFISLLHMKTMHKLLAISLIMHSISASIFSAPQAHLHVTGRPHGFGNCCAMSASTVQLASEASLACTSSIKLRYSACSSRMHTSCRFSATQVNHGEVLAAISVLKDAHERGENRRSRGYHYSSNGTFVAIHDEEFCNSRTIHLLSLRHSQTSNRRCSTPRSMQVGSNFIRRLLRWKKTIGNRPKYLLKIFQVRTICSKCICVQHWMN